MSSLYQKYILHAAKSITLVVTTLGCSYPFSAITVINLKN
jgi:hypothetical protein